MRPPRWRVRARAPLWGARLIGVATLTATLLPCAPADGQGLLPLPRSPSQTLVVLRARVRPGIHIVYADLSVENDDGYDQVWCELWADNVEPPATTATFRRLARDDVLIGIGPVDTTRDVLHLEATAVSVQRFNLRVRCGHARNGTSPLILPDALLSVLDPTDAGADRMTTTATTATAPKRSAGAKSPATKTPPKSTAKTAAPAKTSAPAKPTQTKPTQTKPTQAKPTQTKPTQAKPTSRRAGAAATKP